MKIILINPGHTSTGGQLIKLQKEIAPGLTLPYLAALFPREHEIKIVDDGLEEINYDEPVDMVGITSMTARAPRAYEIADRFREKGVPVIMGGFHASALPEEALEHCTAVVQGEAEGLITKILSDLEAGRLSGVYKRTGQSDLRNLPAPRYDLLNMDNYIWPCLPIQATRGCPNQCEFCSVAAFFGRTYRKRPVSEVIEDMKRAGNLLFIIDDNLSADKPYALELFKRMKPLRKLWGGQFNLSAANDPELVKAAAEAGCLFLYLGVESVEPTNLLSSGKKMNLKVPAEEAIRTLKRHHIDPLISMIVGFENDDSFTVRKIINFCNRTRASLLFLYILTPLPGSPLYERYSRQGVLLKKEWNLYDGTHAVIDSPRMRAVEIEAMYKEVYNHVYAVPSILRRTLMPPHLLVLILNLIFRAGLRKSLHPWMGTRIKEDIIGKMSPIVTSILTHPSIRKVSRIIRYAEGRIIN